jgi:hypothetical protein
MNLLSFRGLLFLSVVGAASLHYKPWEHALPAGRGVVAGRAIDAEGRPVVGASIVLRDTKGVVVGRADSEGNGAFEFTNCAPGRYRLAAAKLGVGGGERGVVVDSHKRADATVPLTGSIAAGHQ